MRLIKNVRANWWDHLINLIVVFLGVTIAFQLSNWKELRDERRLEQEFCRNLISDLESDIYSLQMLVDTLPKHIKNSEGMLRVTYNPETRTDSLAYFINKLYDQWMFFPANSTYKSYQSAGLLDVLKDTKIRKHAALYYTAQFDFIQTMEVSFKEFRLNILLPYLMQNIQYKSQYELKDHSFLGDHYFSNMIFGKLSLERGKLQSYEQALKQAQLLKEELEEYNGE